MKKEEPWLFQNDSGFSRETFDKEVYAPTNKALIDRCLHDLHLFAQAYYGFDSLRCCYGAEDDKVLDCKEISESKCIYLTFWVYESK